ncbi:hypothetical protein QQ020_22100 [Fulvivirgaceae bacterium BMA12]|uniref:Uncharacterized protein n=1 Tax=Agaribacillus aureus TaxID=3051825 RepID=A0ABT8LER4_9BACT|nr:hypothetical protein [Fulvivirgaceae bacterium BMA12]
MKTNTYVQKTERFFPEGLVFGGILMILIGVGALVIKPLLGIILLPAGLSVVFLHYGILIDFEQKRYKEYWGLLGLRFGKWKVLPPVTYISLTKSRFSQQMGLRGATSTMRGVLYKGNLRLDDEEKILVIQSGKKEKVLQTLKYLATKMDIKLLDCTGSDHIWVEL